MSKFSEEMLELSKDKEVMGAFNVLRDHGILNGAMFDKLIDQHHHRIRAAAQEYPGRSVKGTPQ